MIPQIKGSVSQNCPHPLQMPIASLDCYLCFCPISNKSEVFTILFLGSINLLERLIELKKTAYLLFTSLL